MARYGSGVPGPGHFPPTAGKCWTKVAARRVCPCRLFSHSGGQGCRPNVFPDRSSRSPRRSPSRPSPDPAVIDDHLENLEAHGFGDPALAGLANEIIRLRLEGERLDSEGVRRHLATSGFSALLIDIDRAALHSRAPFLKEDVTLAAARSQWSHGFEVLNHLAALEQAMGSAKRDPAPALARPR